MCLKHQTDLAHDVKQEGIYIVVERFVIEEELGERAEVLAVLFLFAPVNLEHRQVTVAIDLKDAKKRCYKKRGEKHWEKTRPTNNKTKDKNTHTKKTTSCSYVTLSCCQNKNSK